MNANDSERWGRIGQQVAQALRARAAAIASVRRWRQMLPWMIGVPVVALALRLAGIGPTGVAASFAWIVLLTFVVPLILVMLTAARITSTPVDARQGLRLLERELGSEGRLIAALEFGARGARTSFEFAAIEDAHAWFARAEDQAIRTDWLPTNEGAWRDVLVPAFSIALALTSAWLAPDAVPDLSGAPRTEIARVDGPATQRRAGEEASRRDDPSAPPPRAVEKPRERLAASKSAQQRTAAPEETPPRDSTGKSGEGATATPTQSSSASESKGFDSAATPPNEASSETKTRKQKPATPKTATERSEKKKLEASGATAGKGTGSGSSKNPGATDWQSKDQVTSDEEERLDNDEEVDDETEESEARGGVQPNLRDRRPAVNRDLQIGFGNRPNPDANGRGGPSEQKKSRGVASLVLGVPLPDHVKGHPNPGRTKITQERVEPRADETSPAPAEPRLSRASSIGPLDSRSPMRSPWLDRIVRDYFSNLRNPSPPQTESSK